VGQPPPAVQPGEARPLPRAVILTQKGPASAGPQPPLPPAVILRQRSLRQSRRLPTKDPCTLTRHQQRPRKPRQLATNGFGRARLQPGRYDPDGHRAFAPEGPACATGKMSAAEIESQQDGASSGAGQASYQCIHPRPPRACFSRDRRYQDTLVSKIAQKAPYSALTAGWGRRIIKRPR
jgi:hypothetical protein